MSTLLYPKFRAESPSTPTARRTRAPASPQLTPPAPALDHKRHWAGPGRTGKSGAGCQAARRPTKARICEDRRAPGSPRLVSFGRAASDLARLCSWPEAESRLSKSKVPQARHQVSIKVSPKDAEMKTAEEPTSSLGQTLEWLRKELAEMQVQDQRLLLTLKHLHSVLQELRAESAHWEDARSSGGASPIRPRAGSEGRGHQPFSSRGLAQLLQGADSRRSSLP
uniref:Uncharacterized protein C20orf202 homolog n=1 Tax=Tursiops truncatus TaxID=9739 RepID=A0A6J3Q3F8_TURTR|nr:uncharacterized protein C20orf202 homolog [Tursiops truncatus]